MMSLCLFSRSLALALSFSLSLPCSLSLCLSLSHIPSHLPRRGRGGKRRGANLFVHAKHSEKSSARNVSLRKPCNNRSKSTRLMTHPNTTEMQDLEEGEGEGTKQRTR